MKLIVFGATGTVGIEIVKQALQNGDEVTAFVRNPEKMKNINKPKLTIYNGDVLNVTDVGNALQNQDAVLCALGDGKTGKIRTFLGMDESYGNLNFIWKHIMFGILLNKAFKDHQLQEIEIIHSNLDYTIVRPSALTDGEITNQYKIGFDGTYKNLNLKITRAEVADFMLRQLKTNEYLKKAVSISN